MDGDSSSISNQNPPNLNFRSRRSSSSVISSTTSPITPRSQQLPSYPTIHHRSTMSRSYTSFHSNTRGGDEDDVQPSSSTSSFNFGLRQRVGGSSNRNCASPLGSPDSTYWGPSPVSNSYPRSGGSGTSDPGGICVVSSSTVDDIPPSPFSPEESTNQSTSTQSVNQNRRVITSVTLPPPAPIVNQSILGGHSGGEGMDSVSCQSNVEIPQPMPSGSSSYTSTSSGSKFSFSSSISLAGISPLRSKIKKASSFERFSAQAQASSNSSSNNNSHPLLVNSISGNSENASSNIQDSNSSISVRPSGIWDTSSTSSAPAPAPLKSNFVSSLHESASLVLPSITKPYHIKKMVARLANELEQRLEAEAAAAQAANEESVSIGMNGSNGSSDDISGGSMIGISTNCSTENGMIPSEPLMRRQLSQSPLNLTESSSSTTTTGSNNFNNEGSSSSSQTGLPMATRNPVISTKTFSSKKIPLTPKQKLLHRMQSGEITIPMSTSPPPMNLNIPPPPSPPPEQTQHQQLLASLQQQQQHLMLQESLHASTPNGMLDEGSTSPCNNDRYTNALSNYEAFIRSTAAEEFSDAMPKVDEGNDSATNQILYDSADAYNYYYGNILTDEIFNSSNNNGGVSVVGLGSSTLPSSSRLIHSSMIQNGMEEDGIQFQVSNSHSSANTGHLEFVLGLPEGHDRSVREDDLQLGNNEEMQQQQQFLDSNGELALTAGGGKASQLAEISTLRNLLMMEPLRTQHDESSWISVAAAEYQNRMNSVSLRMSGNSMSNGLGATGSSSSGSNGVVSSGNNNSWMNEWPSRSWQGQGQAHDEGEQDEVMDMSVMEIEKTHLNSHSIIKRTLQHHHNSHPSHNNGMSMDDVESLVSERDLTNGLPLLTSMPLPMDLQQSFPTGSIQIGKSQIMTDPSALIITPQHHHHRSVILEYDDEPVNLMSAVNLEQALVHHHSHRTSQHSEDLSLSHTQASPEMTSDLANSTYANVCVGGSNIIFTTTSTTSTTVATAGFEPNPPNQTQAFMELMTGHDANIDEKRIIRVKKKKELDSISDSTNVKNGMKLEKANFIPDKPVQPKSFASLPSLLSLTRMSGNGWGVMTNRNKRIPANARFGPVEGPLKRASKADLENNDTVYPVLAMVDSTGVVYQLDRTDDDLCNWMKFVRKARSPQEQNVLVSEEDGLLYFITCRDISAKAELQVGYGLEYAQKYNLQYFVSEGNEICDETENLSRKSIGKRQKRREKGFDLEKWICFECDLNCGSKVELNKHLDNVHPDIDGFRRPKKKAIRKFYNSLNDSVQDGIEEGNSGSDIKFSIKENVEVESTSYTSKRTLKKKEIERLRREQEEIPVVESSSPDTYEIEQPSTESPNVVSNSSNQNLPPGKVKCTLCYKNFATTHRLQKHMSVHSEEDHLKPLKCDLCGKRFLTNSALAGHVKSHEGKYFECPLCDYTTQQLLHLKEHVQSHKNEENGSFSCPHCPKTFSCYSLVRKHIRAFHGPRLFSCEDCSMKFPTPDKLKLHELRHSSFRAYLCAECGRQFKRKDKLTDHTKKAHGKLKQAITQIFPAEPSIQICRSKPKEIKKLIPRLTEEQISKFIYRCQDCMIGFRRRGMLVNHLAKRHPEMDRLHVPELALPITQMAKNYYCPHCERIYKSSSKRKSHILKNHPGKSVPPQVRGKDLKAILEEKVGSTTLDLNLNDFEGTEMEQIKETVDQVIRKETVVGEIIRAPHACDWCHRQYATRAKLLQHQRKFHIQLMPPEIQTPRPQKNNVKLSMENSETSDMDKRMMTVDDIENDDDQSESSPSVIDDSESTLVEPLKTEHQLISVVPQSQENMYGYLITTTTGHVTNNDIESLLQPEFVMSLLSQQQTQVNTTSSSNTNNPGTRTITLCIPSGLISNQHTLSSNSTSSHLISTGINVNGNQILTKTD